MNDQQRSLEQIQDIKKMMERSSRFISLSGWSGVAAGGCALVGAWFGHGALSGGLVGRQAVEFNNTPLQRGGNVVSDFVDYTNLVSRLIWIAFFTFIAAFVLAFLFTWIRSKKQNIPLWGNASMRLAVNVIIPMMAGGFFLLRALQLGYWEILAPGCLIFYGLALVNGSKYTLGEIKYLGYLQIILGIINLWFVGSGLLFWAAGFGIMHILYGLIMWWKYERS
ncbi:MAG: hypothetical protein ABIX01_08925 [Chitinophagaceae bacterium]